MIASTTMGRLAIALLALAMPASALAEPTTCRPVAMPSGEPVLVRQLSERLVASGIATTPIAGCPSARVRLEQRGEQIHLEVTDSFGRSGTREVRDVATAATIVESWTSQEIDEGSLPPVPAVRVAAVEPAASIATVAPVALASARWSHGVTGAIESAAGSDGSIWMGAAMTGCVRFGAVCAGMLVRAARDTRVGNASIVNPDTDELSALATVGTPRRLGRFTLTPGVGLGYGWMRVTEHHLDAHTVPFDLKLTGHAMRADVHVSAARALGRRLSLYVELRGDTAVVRSDSFGPRSFVRAAIGLRVGAE